MPGESIKRSWRDSVLDALVRSSVRYGPQGISRQVLLTHEMDRIVEETQSKGATPGQTLSYVLQTLRDEGVLEFLSGGSYRILKEPIDAEAAELTDSELEAAIRQRLLRFGRVKTGTVIAEYRQRRGQSKLRDLVLQNYRGQCALCDVSDTELLVASHIVPWADGPDARGDLSNVIGLCCFHDALFERGQWSLNEDLSVVRRSPITSHTLQQLLPERVSFLSPIGYSPEPDYLRFHRERHGFGA